MFEQLADKGTLGVSSWAFDKNRLTLIPQITEFIEAVTYYLELEPDKNSDGAKELILHFCNFIKKMFENFECEYCDFRFFYETPWNCHLRKKYRFFFCTPIPQFLIEKNSTVERRANLLKRDLRKKIFLLFSHSAGKYALKPDAASEGNSEKISNFQYAVLQSMCAVLCCGPCFSPNDWIEDSPYYLWLDTMLNSNEEKVSHYVFKYVHIFTE